MVTAATRVIMIKVFNVDSVPVLLVVGTLTGIVIPIIFYNVMMKAGAWWLFTLRKPAREKKEKKAGKSNYVSSFVSNIFKEEGTIKTY